MTDPIIRAAALKLLRELSAKEGLLDGFSNLRSAWKDLHAALLLGRPEPTSAKLTGQPVDPKPAPQQPLPKRVSPLVMIGGRVELPSHPVEPETTRGQLQWGLDCVAGALGRPSLLVGEHAGAVVEAIAERDATIAKLTAEIEAARAEVRSVINRDRTGLAGGLVHVMAIARGYQWIPDGHWGSYEADAQGEAVLREECGNLIRGVVDGCTRYLRASGARADEAAREEVRALGWEPGKKSEDDNG